MGEGGSYIGVDTVTERYTVTVGLAWRHTQCDAFIDSSHLPAKWTNNKVKMFPAVRELSQ